MSFSTDTIENGDFADNRGVARDVTARANSEMQLHTILDAVPDAIITIDENGIINSFSPTTENLFGYTANEVIGRNVKMLMPSPYHDEHDGYLESYKTTGKKKIIGIGRDVEAQRKDGSVFPMHLSVNEMLIDGTRMYIGVVQDRSEVSQAQILNTRVGRILDRSLNEIYVFNAETLEFIQVNFGARRNTGYSSKEFRQLTPVDIKPEFTAEQFAELVKPLRDGSKETLVFKTVHQRKDGTTYPVEISLQLMRDETPAVFVAIIQDFTEIERREAKLRQSQKMEAIGQLTGGIAHDFNNLLTVIIGNNELLADRLGDDELSNSLLNDASAAAESGAKLTGQLLAFARQQTLDPKSIDLNGLVQEISEVLTRTLGETVRLETKLASDLGKAFVDPAQLHNALLNLAINARDAMPDGGDLTIETGSVVLDADMASQRAEVDPGNYVRLSITDTGVGMSAEVRDRVLEPFFTTKEQGKGTGLGLSMVHGFAKQSGGHLEIYSEEGFGTTVSLYLPDARETVEDGAKDDKSASPSKGGGETVLVVEDDPRVRKITVKRLEHLGYDVIEAEAGPQALERLANSADIDVVFTDMVMPGGMTGGELLKEVHQKYPDIKRLITSGYAEDGVIPNDGTKWLRKPYLLAEMARIFREVLD